MSGLSGIVGGSAAPSGPTVLADLNYLTDSGILNMVGAPIENGFYVGTWPWAVGGTATSALAIAAGADGSITVAVVGLCNCDQAPPDIPIVCNGNS
ncbi:MAG: hypothetical protein K1X57_21475, partial [Gemmataceae bacterium]|nr:hypothetical protein [Gemmataceae bacterium]